MTSENAKDSADSTIFTNVKTKKIIPIDQKLLRKPLKRYLEMKFWTREQCAFLAAGVLHKSNKIPTTVTGLNNEILLDDEKVFRLYNADRILEELVGDDMPDKISPTDFYIWLKARPYPEIMALKRLAEIEELKSEAITVASTTEIKESVEQRQARRLKMCEDTGLTMDEKALRRMPDGIGEVAKREGISRQAFTDDVEPALKRKLATKERETIHRA